MTKCLRECKVLPIVPHHACEVSAAGATSREDLTPRQRSRQRFVSQEVTSTSTSFLIIFPSQQSLLSGLLSFAQHKPAAVATLSASLASRVSPTFSQNFLPACISHTRPPPSQYRLQSDVHLTGGPLATTRIDIHSQCLPCANETQVGRRR